MKVVKVTLEVEVPDGVDIDIGFGLKGVVLDSFAEFAKVRSPAEGYVDTRYPNTREYAWLDRDEKVREVANRVLVADALHRGAFNLTIERK